MDEVTKSEDMFVLGVFISDVSIVTDNDLDMKAFHINVSRKTDYGLTGEIEHHSCFLYPAAVNYTLSLDSGILSFKSSNRSNDTVVELLKLDQLEIFETISSVFFRAESTASFSSNEGEWAMTSGGLMANLYYGTDLTDSFTKEPDHVRFDDPMEDIINSFREIALRMSVREAVEKNIAEVTQEGEPILVSPLVVFQNLSYESEITVVRYTTDEDALALGVVVSLIGPMATLVLFWGFWNLGRRVTMSPLEMINALSVSSATGAQNGATDVARIFADCKSNVEGAGVANYVRKADSNGKGEPKLQYGVVEETGRLGMVVVDEMHPERRRVRRPMKGEVL
ncbi:hypothetical protein B0T20DRAFT_511482 [Sordaria brevicollis]|uniref:Uncharacterized protein n=1 Tax=Sordaria brevicollis TaxID=83679 RepID=A0AAE0NV80_SORBR|nr:hypothetical protein B0T20DRAFT_511482 [Sordaria brevicollis]